MTARAFELLGPYVPLLQTLLWVALIVAGAIVFRKQAIHICEGIRRRIETGSSFKAGPVELGSDIKSLAYAPQNDISDTSSPEESGWATERTEIYQNNRGMFLTHIISPSDIPGQKYDVFIYLIRHKTTDFVDVEKAEFFFGHMWGNRVFEEPEKNGMIGVSTSAYGPFLCTCRVHFKDGSHIKLNRYIDFEMERAFQ